MSYLFWLIILGYIFQSIFSSFGGKRITIDYGSNRSTAKPKDFETSLLLLASIVIKADGVVNQTELNYVRQYFATHYGKEKANQAFDQFREAVKRRIPPQKICAEIREFMPAQARIQLIKFLFGVANADGNITPAEELEIRRIASYMWIGQNDYIILRNFYYKQQQRYDYTYSKDSDYSYEVLGLSEKATADDIKKAYRKLVKKYHPDRLQNASKDDLQVAKEKFQKIQAAYETIKKKRGFS